MIPRSVGSFMINYKVLSCCLAFLLGLILVDQLSAQNAATNGGASESLAVGVNYVVYVSTQQAMLHSGPSKEAYPTSVLRRGHSLDVYSRTEDGWLGVRPPQGSFSWVRAADAYLLPGGKIIEITSSTAVSWIGSSLGSAKSYQWQVRLKPGEQLSLQGETTVQEDGKPTLWYKVAPPAGEFRFIEERFTNRTPPTTEKLRNRNLVTTAAYQEEFEALPSPASPSEPRQPSSVLENPESVAIFPQNTSNLEGETIYEGQLPPGGTWYNGEYVIGELPEELLNDEGYVDGDVIYDGNPDFSVIDSEVLAFENNCETQPAKKFDPFRGWQLFELTDDGMRISLFDRITGRTPVAHDPRDHDPFSLAMPQKSLPVSEPSRDLVPGPNADRSHESLHGSHMQSSISHPWRDPRLLRQNRLNGRIGQTLSYDASPSLSPTANPENVSARSLADLGSHIGDNLRQLRSPISEDFSRGTFHSDSLSATARTRELLDKQPLNAEQSGNLFPADGQLNSDGWYGIGARPTGPASTVVAQPVGFSGHTRDYDAMLNYSVGDLQLQLSEMVALPITQWDFTQLVARTQQIIDNGSDAIMRGQARLLLERIVEFQTVANRQLSTTNNSYAGTMPFTSNASTNGNSSISQASWTTLGGMNTNQSASLVSNQHTNFDATGYLVAIKTSSLDQPPYALQDNSGQTIAYVSTLPGMKLDMYLNQAIGIYGLRGYLPSLQANLIQAERVVRIR
ncbi:MAG: SH3 domain-containing protein [Planctomycetales bacterium]|nr:SH3 domain-containing protein [Planctomycetales bacterium]